jgi:hypothetical protein
MTELFCPDCLFFKGDSPCKYTILEGKRCRCEYYKKVRKKLLLVKVKEVSAVILLERLLPMIRQYFTDYQITLLTDENLVDFFTKKTDLDRVFGFTWTQVERLKKESFDLICCLDIDAEVVSVVSSFNSVYRDGFKLDESGVVVPANKKALSYYLFKIRLGKRKGILDFYKEVMGL